LVAATAMTGVNGARAAAIDQRALQAVLKQHGRLNAPPALHPPID
jgi:hypothetical protein